MQNGWINGNRWFGSVNYLTIRAHHTGNLGMEEFTTAEQHALARNVTFRLILAVNALYVVKRTPTRPIEMHAGDRYENAKAGQVVKCVRIETSASTDASSIPDFRVVFVNLSEQRQPGLIITKAHLNDYQGVLRGANQLHHVRDGGQEMVFATQLPLGTFDDTNMSQVQGGKVRRGVLDLNGIFGVAQFSTALSRFVERDGIHIGALGRYAHYEDQELKIHWPEIARAIRVHPRAIAYWHDIGELDPDFDAELEQAQADIAEMESRRAAGCAAFSVHRGRTSDRNTLYQI